MNFDDIKKNLDDSLKQINNKMLEQEKVKHEEFIKHHFEKYDALSDKVSSSEAQLITLEGVIFAAIVILGKPEQASVWLFVAICFILVSLFFGVWSQKIGIQSSYQTHEDNYYQEVKSNWWRRELWGDETVKTEKDLIEPHIEQSSSRHKKTFGYKVLAFLHLNADRVENIFRGAFLVAILFLIIHFVSLALMDSKVTTHIYRHESKFFRMNNR